VVLQGLAFTLFGSLFLLFGLGAAVFRSAVSKGHRAWMEMFAGRRGREAAEAMSEGTWLAIGVMFGLLGLGLLFVGLNLLLRH
jgi:hypothetical protein